MATISSQLRKDIWEGRYFAYRLMLYHGKLAEKRARTAQLRMMVGCALAIASPYLQLISGSLDSTATLIALVGAVLAVHTLAVGHEKSTASMRRSLQLKHLQNDWDALWERVEAYDTEADYLRTRYKELAGRMDDITAGAIDERVDEKLLDKVFTDATNYFNQGEEGMSVATT